MIEKMVLFENQKQLEETRDELERCKRFSFRLYAKELPLELTLSLSLIHILPRWPQKPKNT